MESLYLSSSPHVFANVNVRRIMLDVILALIPATICGAVFFGAYTLLVVAVTVGAAVLAEFACNKLQRKPATIKDLSAVVTGLLLSLNLPPQVPLWLPVIGAVFAVAIAKMAFGGLGQNFINPALAARCLLLISWPVIMTTWQAPFVDAVAQATPLVSLGAGDMAQAPSLLSLFLGNVPGCIGETSALALLAGGVYLLARRVINFRTPVVFIATVFVLTTLFAPGGVSPLFGLYEILSGGLFLGAFFMATDYASTPVNGKAKIVFALGCGVFTSVIRLFGGYPEGVSFAILIMNLTSPLLEKAFKPRVYGVVKDKKGKKEAASK